MLKLVFNTDRGACGSIRLKAVQLFNLRFLASAPPVEPQVIFFISERNVCDIPSTRMNDRGGLYGLTNASVKSIFACGRWSLVTD